MVRASFPWSDLGSWSDLYAARLGLGLGDGDANVVSGDVLTIDSRDCLVDSRGGNHPSVWTEELQAVLSDGLGRRPEHFGYQVDADETASAANYNLFKHSGDGAARKCQKQTLSTQRRKDALNR